MNCPKCGSPISKSAVVCSTCGMPVALMSGTKGSSEVITPPLGGEPAYVDPFMHPDVAQEALVNKTPDIYQNYGEAKRAIMSFKFLLPILIGILLSIGVGFGMYSVFKLYMQDKAAEPILENTTYQVKWNNFIYTLSSDYTYSKPSPSLFEISTNENEWNVTIQSIQLEYITVQKQKNKLKSYFQTKGYTVKEAIETTYNGISFLTMEATKGSKNYLLALTKAGNTKFSFGMVLTKQDNTFGYDLLDLLSLITKNVAYKKEETQKEILEFDFTEAFQ